MEQKIHMNLHMRNNKAHISRLRRIYEGPIDEKTEIRELVKKALEMSTDMNPDFIEGYHIPKKQVNDEQGDYELWETYKIYSDFATYFFPYDALFIKCIQESNTRAGRIMRA